ncbi:hypothetical protein PSEUDO8AS_40067 [Pseudomonas sp. 8AS]|nr:hypothetical protein PSEUDO8AS_40067 [Pseudomonas sp. 8AS]
MRGERVQCINQSQKVLKNSLIHNKSVTYEIWHAACYGHPRSAQRRVCHSTDNDVIASPPSWSRGRCGVFFCVFWPTGRPLCA